MQNTNFKTHSGFSPRNSLMTPVLLLWGLCLAIVIFLLWFNAEQSMFGSMYLIPWCIVAGIILFLPSIYFYYKGKFDFFHPLTFGVLSYLFPAFVVGGFLLAAGWSEPYYLSYIEDPEYELPLSLLIVVLGYIGMTVGYFLPVGKKVVPFLERKKPHWEWKPSQIWLGGIILVLCGFGVNIVGFFRGLVGYQRVETAEAFDGLISFFLILLAEGNILLWLAVFQTKKRSAIFYAVLALLLAIIPMRVALLGSRSSLMASVVPIMMAFFYSGRKLKWQHTVIFGTLIFAAISIGIIYGTTFRNIKGSESRMEAGDYLGQVGATLEYLSDHDLTLIVGDGAKALAERVENLSSLGVVVSNYEKLAPYEAAYGLENNILNDVFYSFIPRFLWNDKPSTSNARVYSDLYFNYSENSFTVTPFGDLLRNFGLPGVFFGMMLVGVYFRVLYGFLIDTPNPALWKKVAYLPLLSVVSYEDFFAVIFPSIIRILFVLAVSLFLVNLTVKKQKANSES